MYRQLCHYFDSETYYRIELVREFCKLLSCGELLSGISNEWLEPVRFELSKEVVGVLLKIAKQYDMDKDYELQLTLGETILKWDNLEQKGLELSILSLNKLGNYGRLNETYKLFADIYKKTFEKEFPHTLESFMRKNG
jgi:two-component SAPR family response regulator